MLTFHVLKQGKVAIGGSTGAVLERTLNSLVEVVDRSIAKVRVATGLHVRSRIRVSEVLEEIRVSATIEAANGDYTLEVSPLDQTLEIESDRLIVVGAVINLLRNAFKFSPRRSTIGLRVLRVSGERLCIEVEDECGGLPPGLEEEIFQSFVQRGSDRSGLGIGLAVSRQTSGLSAQTSRCAIWRGRAASSP